MRLIPIAAIAGAAIAGYGAYRLSADPGPDPNTAAPSPSSPQVRYNPAPSGGQTVRLPDLAGEMRSLADWRGQIVVLNFWATWCPPCRREIPALIELHEAWSDRSVHVVGVAIDDKSKVVDYVDEIGINYPVLVGETDAIALARAYGNQVGALPYTVVLDRQGSIIERHKGEITRDEAEAIIRSAL